MTETTGTNLDEREDRQRIGKTEASAGARELFWGARHGVLCTLSAKVGGWPFGSVVPYAIDARGRPILMVATIAEHFKNVQADDRVSLFVQAGQEAEQNPEVDVQTFGRVTVMGRASLATPEERQDMAPRYYFRLPGSRSYHGTHDFVFLKVDIERIRYIGGFGKIFWLDPTAFHVDPQKDILAEGSAGAVAHMNEDHRDAMADMVKGFYGLDVPPAAVEMTAVDERGLWIDVAEHGRHRIDFEKPANPDTLRVRVVESVKVARARLASV
ncbi:MAG: DUF2470 domain-containing protein [Myxococcota bacterium]